MTELRGTVLTAEVKCDAHRFARRCDVRPQCVSCDRARIKSQLLNRSGTAATRGKGSVRRPVRAILCNNGGMPAHGDITRDGNTVAVHIVTEIAQDQINNPVFLAAGRIMSNFAPMAAA